MKPKLLLLTLTFLHLLTTTLNAQELKQKQLDYLSQHGIELIDSAKLYNEVLKDNGKVKMVAIFTNYCVGTPYLFKDITKMKEQFGDKMEYILCSSAPKKRMDDLVQVLKANNYTGKVYFIDPAQYKEKSDDRKKGFDFRNAICEPCRDEVIGTPYRIFFSTKSEVLFHGYSSRNDFEKMLTEYFSNE
ncbi:MAG: hypothetical protein H6551_00220 [Chitinophagales bacterium]|nr:hypothetical protein [Chitinophagales bacterium]